MKFTYQYRTPDNKSHKGVIKAASKEAAYAALKAQGIKPGRVEEAPGFFNKLFGKGKRWIAIAVLSVAVVVAVFYVSRSVRESRQAMYASEARGQVYADAATLQAHEADGWASAFSDAGDRVLVAFAQPGKAVDAKQLNIRPETLNTRLVRIDSGDADEVKRMKRIVNGMKLELDRYCKAGGNKAGYVERLVERQALEGRVANYLKNDIDALRRKAERLEDKSEVLAKWREKNVTLRDMGFKTIPLPEDWEMSELEEKGGVSERVTNLKIPR